MKASLVTLAAVAAGALAGVAVVSVKEMASSGSAAPSDDRSAARTIEQRLELLESSIETLSGEIGALEAAAGAGPVRTPTPPPRVSSVRAAPKDPSESERRLAEARARMDAALGQLRAHGEAIGELVRPEGLESRLISRGGFLPERAREINARVNELLDEGRARVDEYREATGRDPYPVVIENLDNMDRTLREELGEPDYERYRRAASMPTSVHVARALPGSTAQAAGIAPGDEIVVYDGRRVMDLRQLEALAAEGEPNAPVLVEVMRDGQRLQMVMLRGAPGVTELDAISRLARERAIREPGVTEEARR